MVTTSLKTQIVALEAPPVWLFEPTLKNYQEALFEDGVLRTLINSLLVAVSTTLLALILGVPAAFALARFEFLGKKDLWFWFITNRMVSPIVLALPVFSDCPQSWHSRQAHHADPNLSDIQSADRDLDCDRPVPGHSI
jgi:multiple sugar transport system permease protein